MRFRACKTSSSLSDHYQGGSFIAVFLCCTSVVLYVAFVLSLFLPNLSFVWCLGKPVLRDSDISWVSTLRLKALLNVVQVRMIQTRINLAII